MPQPSWAKRYSTAFTALFFALLLMVGLLTAADYGQPWDEPWEQDILRMNLNQYASALGLQERITLTSSMDAPDTGLIADSEEKDHGECAYYPFFWLVTQPSLSAATRMTLWHMATWLWFVAGAGALWLIARRMGLSRLLSSIAALLLVLTPRMFAEGHYNNKDMVLLSLVLILIWLMLRLMEKPSLWRGLWFSLAGAVAANTKIIGLFVWGLCALFALVHVCVTSRMKKSTWLTALGTFVSFIALYALLTPALWADPAAYLKYVIANAANFSRWQNNVLFRGVIFRLRYTRLPWYYLPYMILVTTPLWLLGLLAIGQIFAAVHLLRSGAKTFRNPANVLLGLCTVLWLAPLLFAMVGHPTLYNGWRHFYFLYGPMLVLAVYGIQRLGQMLSSTRHSKMLRRVGAGLLAVCLAVSGSQIALAHPNQYTYYNALVRGKDLPEYLELDYWNVSVLPTLESLLAASQSTQPVTIAGAEYWSQTGLESAYALLPIEKQARILLLPMEDVTADYILSNRTYAVLGNWRTGGTLPIAVKTESFGQTLCTIYAQSRAAREQLTGEVNVQ